MIRKSLIYKTAVEYGDYTLNYVQGCSHGCKYPCYAFQMSKRFGTVKTYEEWIKPKIVENTMELLDKEIPKYKDKIDILHLCFTTDPFMMGQDDVIQLSMSVLKKANDNGIKCSVLTKGLLPIELADFNKENEYGITIITLDDDFRKKMEPGTASIEERIKALEALHNKGCKTWVSMEPYPTPNFIEQNLSEILERLSFTDKIIFGRMHYNKKVSEYKKYKTFYNKCAKEVINFCETRGIDYHIKKRTITES